MQTTQVAQGWYSMLDPTLLIKQWKRPTSSRDSDNRDIVKSFLMAGSRNALGLFAEGGLLDPKAGY